MPESPNTHPPRGKIGLAILLAAALHLGAAAAPDPNDQPDSPLPDLKHLRTRPTPGASATLHDLNAPPPQDRGLFYLFDLRVQPEAYDFFKPDKIHENNYLFVGSRIKGAVGYSGDDWDAKVELQNIFLGGLPSHAIVPGPAGALGQGASYDALTLSPVSDTLGIRQLYFRYGGATGALGSPVSSDIKVGRFDYSSGMEAPSKDPVLDWIKRERLSKKVIGQPDYNIFSRSFDGARFDIDSDDVRVTGFIARPTQAEPHFAVDVNRVLTTNLAVTLKQDGAIEDGELQFYYNHLDDNRLVPQVDSRPSQDRSSVFAEGGDHINTFGFQYVTHIGEDGDLALWYGHQSGSWGREVQDANAFTAEAGLRLPDVALQPWIRVGYSLYSGDDDPTHHVHGTWVAELSDPRVRYNMFTFANLHDAVGELILHPSQNLVARIDAHFLSLDSASDLWYSGSGVQQAKGANGISGKPSGGSKDLGQLYEFFLQQKLDAKSTLQLRYLRALGGSVVRATYPTNPDGSFLFVEYHLTL